jgi:3-phosphoshikimate 1-carboxyvinyltransferase
MRVEPATSLAGHIGVPGDKSISHRAVLIGAVCDGETVVEGFGRSGDTEATIAAVRSLGAEVVEEDVDRLVVRGVGLRGLGEPEAAIDCANAGTLMRLLAGLLAAQDGRSFELTGDGSLRSRPMERVAEPLRRMGAEVETTEGRAPLLVWGGPLHGIEYELPVASAQVKSAVLLAGLSAEGRTTVVEHAPSRDHTELMLAAAGARVTRTPASVAVEPAEALSLDTVQVPGDFSSAAPFIVAATLLPGSELTIHGLGVNPRRTGLLDVLDRMGARIAVFNRRRVGGEPVADVEVRSADLVATAIGPKEVPALVDELPLFALAAGMAHGDSVVTGAEELRHKETDRINSVTNVLRTLGIHVQASDDGLWVRGVPTRPKGGGMGSDGDHRIAMLGAVAGLVSREGVEIQGAEAAAISFPGFFELLDSVRIR